MPCSCARCNTVVNFKEDEIALGKFWHKSCFNCANKPCSRRLDSGNLIEYNGEIYCRCCYGKLFESNGNGYGDGAGVLSMDTADAYQNGSPTSNIPTVAQAHVAPLKAPVVTEPSENGLEEPGTCPRCKEDGYMAEKMMGGESASYKTTYFSCKECHKRQFVAITLCDRQGEIYCKTNKLSKRLLDRGNLTEHDGEIYCCSCYGKLFESNDNGYVSSMDTADAYQNGPSTSMFEHLYSLNIKHFKKLCEPVTQCSNGNGCGVGAGVLSMDNADAYQNGSPTSDIPAIAQVPVAPLKAPVVTEPSENGLEKPGTCPRCKKDVYMAEKMMCGGSAWHKATCFNCKECHKRLESLTLFERKGEIYCKTCYRKLCGFQGYGYGEGVGGL